MVGKFECRRRVAPRALPASGATPGRVAAAAGTDLVRRPSFQSRTGESVKPTVAAKRPAGLRRVSSLGRAKEGRERSLRRTHDPLLGMVLPRGEPPPLPPIFFGELLEVFPLASGALQLFSRAVTLSGSSNVPERKASFM